MTPKMVTIWVPAFRVMASYSLPIVPRSHLFLESAILRNRPGSGINGDQYSVASIKSWNVSPKVQRVLLNDDELIIFSSNLTHGLAYNNNNDTTRTSFELTLYEA